MFGGTSLFEILLVAFLLILLFGAKRIPGIARGLGEAIRNFKVDVKEPDRLEDAASEESEDDLRRK